jgi:5-dehydro-2-deoxygluconokinase
VVPPKDHPSTYPDVLYRSLKRLYNLGIYPAWWKIEAQSAEQWRQLDELIEERDPYCRGVVLLGLNASAQALAEGFQQASQSRTCRGFAVGRTIFQEPSRAWMAGEIDDETLIQQVQQTFEQLIQAWRSSRI